MTKVLQDLERATDATLDLGVYCSDVFAARLPRGQARLVYADPPYMREDLHGYGAAPEPEALLELLFSLGADDCAYVLHAGWWQLETLLPPIDANRSLRRSPEIGHRYRIACWVKPWRRAGRNAAGFQSMWEPILLFFGRDFRYPPELSPVADWICALRQERSLGAHPTMKPPELVAWLFDRLLPASEAAGRLALDLFAGTGSAAIEAARRGASALAVERDADFCAQLVERALAEPEPPPAALRMQVNGHGKPAWPTFGQEVPSSATAKVVA